MKALSLTALGFGVAFGFLLSWGGMTDPDVIRDMLMLKSFDMFLMMGAAMAVGIVGVHALKRFRAVDVLEKKPVAFTRTMPSRNHVIGSVIFGLGWSLTCTCPGPLAAQVGRGQILALAVVAGVLVGAWLRGVQQARTTTTSTAAPARVTS